MSAKTQILVVDDEADQLQTIRRGLFLLGVDCLTARGAIEALSYLSGPAGEQIALLLTDLTMPGNFAQCAKSRDDSRSESRARRVREDKSGAQLVEMARAARPGLPVLVITGLALSSEVEALREAGVPILRKPFTPDQLGRAINTLLTTNERTNERSKEIQNDKA